jgi:hypothetical protein
VLLRLKCFIALSFEGLQVLFFHPCIIRIIPLLEGQA